MAANLIKAIRAAEAYSMGEETGVAIVAASLLRSRRRRATQ